MYLNNAPVSYTHLGSQELLGSFRQCEIDDQRRQGAGGSFRFDAAEYAVRKRRVSFPVSYTHLDVYKRQLQHSDKGYDLTDNPYAMATLDQSIGQVAAASAKERCCLLYTSQTKTSSINCMEPL